MSMEPDRTIRSPAPTPITPRLGRPGLAAPIPIPPTTLLGRERELAAASDLIRRDDVRLVALTGPGGVGKTRLAIAVAAATALDFADGVAYVELAAVRDEALVGPTIALAPGIGGVDGGRVVERLATHLRERELLLVLDNFEQVLEAAPLISQLLRVCAGLKVLVTTRSVLRISGEWDVAVPPLPLPDPDPEWTAEALSKNAAIRLFVERAQAAKSDFALTAENASAIASICRRLDGLPLAIELAAPRIRIFTPSALEARLNARLPLLIDGPRDLPARQRTLRDAIAWSVDSLGPGERALFAQLAVFSGGFTMEAAESVCDSQQGVNSVVDGIATLVAMSLVTHEHTADTDAIAEPRYQMLETIREFAVELLHEREDASSIRDAHADWMVALTEEAATRFAPRSRTPEASVWLRRLTSEHDNLRSALSWLEEHGRWNDLLRLAGATVYFWELRLLPREGRTWLERALLPERTNGAPPRLRARAVSGLGLLLLRFGDYPAAEANLEDARATFIELGDGDGAAFAQRMLAASAEYQGQEELAAARQIAALELYRAANDPIGISAALDDLSDGAYRRGDYDESWRLGKESVAFARIGESPARLIFALTAAGEAATARSDVAGAAELVREALQYSHEMGYDLGIFDSLAGMAAVATEAGDLVLGAKLQGAATALADARGMTTMPHYALFVHTRTVLKEALGEAAFAAAWEAGRALAPEQAMAEALAPQWETAAVPSNVLSPREREIFRLLASGLTNRAIGQELFISERTVDSHVSRIFRKLDVRTRAEAIAVGRAAGRGASPPTTPIKPE